MTIGNILFIIWFIVMIALLSQVKVSIGYPEKKESLKEVKNYDEYGQKNEHYFHRENGERQGEYKQWWQSGTLATRFSYKDGEIHGVLMGWYENGIKCRQYNYENGVLNGQYKTWDCVGNLKKHLLYLNGKIVKNFLKGEIQ